MKIACTLTADSDEPDDLETLRLLAQAPTLAKVLYELCNNDMFSNAVRRAASKHCLLHNIDFEEIYT